MTASSREALQGFPAQYGFLLYRLLFYPGTRRIPYVLATPVDKALLKL
jgi:hypothetical protein